MKLIKETYHGNLHRSYWEKIDSILQKLYVASSASHGKC